jgi:hypothetical protein
MSCPAIENGQLGEHFRGGVMSEPGSRPGPDDPQDSAREPKPFEKVKSDEEKSPEKLKIEGEKIIKEIEKVKSDNEKLAEKIKPEKEVKLEKLEFKEHKHEKLEKPEKEKPEKEKPEKEKIEKPEKEQKFEKLELKEHKFEIKEHKPELEKPPASEVFKQDETSQPPQSAGAPPIDRDALMRHAEALESMGRELRHFIERSERPDLSHGALHNEPDQQDESDGGA